MLKDCPDKYKAQKICLEAVDDSLSALKFVPDLFVASKKFHDPLFANDDILFLDEDFCIV